MENTVSAKRVNGQIFLFMSKILILIPLIIILSSSQAQAHAAGHDGCWVSDYPPGHNPATEPPWTDPECQATPEDGCDVRSSVQFNAGTHNLPIGIDVCVPDVVVNCNGATLSGAGATSNVGINLAFMALDKIINCQIKNYGTGIFLDASASHIINSSIIFNNSIGISIGASFGNTVDNSIVRNNVIGISIGLHTADLNTVQKNLINNNFVGIEIFDLANSNVVQNNTIINNINRGVHLYANTPDISQYPASNTIRHNTIRNSSNGILITNAVATTIFQNNITYNENVGIKIVKKDDMPSAPDATDTSITENKVNVNGYGVLIQSDPTGTLHKNVICANEIQDISRNLNVMGFSGNTNRCDIVTNWKDTGVQQACARRCPVIFIPGTAGTKLKKDGAVIWPNMGAIIQNESVLDFLKLNNESTGPEDPSVKLEVDDAVDNVKVRVSKVALYRGHFLIDNFLGDVIGTIFNITVTKDFYGKFLDSLVEDGYKRSNFPQTKQYAEDDSLFTFPFDWRKYPQGNANLLKEKIEEVKNVTGSEKVNIITHSVGGLITTTYLNANPTHTNHVDKVIFGVPNVHGSSNAYWALHPELGDTGFTVPYFGYIIKPQKIPEVMRNHVGIYVQSPNKWYFDKFTYMVEVAIPPYGTSSQPLKLTTIEDTYKNNNVSKLPNQFLVDKSIEFMDQSQGSDHKNEIDHRGKFYDIIGHKVPDVLPCFLRKEKNPRFSQFTVYGSAGPDLRPFLWRFDYCNTDGTIQSLSQYGWTKQGKDDNWYLVDLSPEGFDTVHAHVLGIKEVQTTIKNILRGKPNEVPPSHIKKTSKPLDSLGVGRQTTWRYYAHSPVDIFVFDNKGNITSLFSEPEGVKIAGSGYLKAGDTTLVTLPELGSYSILMRGTDNGLVSINLEKVRIEENISSTSNDNISILRNSTTLLTFGFDQFPVQKNSLARFDIDQDAPSTSLKHLFLDFDGDRKAESIIIPLHKIRAWIIDGNGNISNLQYDGSTNSYTDGNIVNGNRILRIISDDSDKISEKYVGLGYKTGNAFVRIDGSANTLTLLSPVIADEAIGFYANADIQINTNARYPGAVSTVVSNDSTVSADDEFIRIDPLFGWLQGNDTTTDAWIPNFDSYDIATQMNNGIITVNVISAYKHMGEQITVDENLITVGIMNVSSFGDYLDSGITSLNNTMMLNTQNENIFVVVNGLIEKLILQHAPDLKITNNDIQTTQNGSGINVHVHNIGNDGADDFNIVLQVNNNFIELKRMTLLPNSSGIITFDLKNVSGNETLTITVDKSDEIVEFNETNNEVTIMLGGDDDVPSINLLFPANNALITNTNNITFAYTATDITSEIASCRFKVQNTATNATIIQNDTTVTESVSQNFTQSLQNGNYAWQISCKDNSINANEGFSETRTLTVAVIQSAPTTPQAQIQSLIDDVDDLINSNIISNGIGTSLKAKLNAAKKMLDQGKKRPAKNQLNAFINQVNALMKANKLTQQQGQQLINGANAVMG